MPKPIAHCDAGLTLGIVFSCDEVCGAASRRLVGANGIVQASPVGQALGVVQVLLPEGRLQDVLGLEVQRLRPLVVAPGFVQQAQLAQARGVPDAVAQTSLASMPT